MFGVLNAKTYLNAKVLTFSTSNAIALMNLVQPTNKHDTWVHGNLLILLVFRPLKTQLD